ncbi:MAG: thiamine pyrophosphate-dependent dehydrogenase E1 component subunit alpha, partial [Bdellovibrionales bacterium]|nr:thiamine pyrophosphate-dependent dehydrogenase E1 component subunit alpha [Bdellovibrionales bacterium]
MMKMSMEKLKSCIFLKKTISIAPFMTTDKDLNKIPKETLLLMYENMVKSRVLEERCIRLYKMGDAYFWIGGAGEEGFGVPLGMLADKGQGPKHDWLHLHYRCTPTLVAMGMPMVDSIRLIMNRATDRSTGGRNFSSHYAYPEWNVAPVTSPIEVQYVIALGTAWVQRRHKSKGITIVTGGDAGTAEGDFASCLVWASRKGYELPMFIVVTNNRWGISTSYDGQHGEERIADRGKAFGMRTEVINGNDPVESYLKQKECMDYIRKTGKPLLAEFAVSRLYGHSSASGANYVKEEDDPVKLFEQRLIQASLLTEKKAA